MIKRQELYKTRIKRNLSQGQIAEALNCSRSTIAQIERGFINGGDNFDNYYILMIALAYEDGDTVTQLRLAEEQKEQPDGYPYEGRANPYNYDTIVNNLRETLDNYKNGGQY